MYTKQWWAWLWLIHWWMAVTFWLHFIGLFALLNNLLQTNGSPRNRFFLGGGGARKGKWILLVASGCEPPSELFVSKFSCYSRNPTITWCSASSRKGHNVTTVLRSDNQVKCIKRIEEPSKYHEVTASTTTRPPPRGEQQAYTHNAQ